MSSSVAGRLTGALRLGVGAVVLVASLVAAAVHGASILGVDVEALAPEVWYLHGGAMVVVLLALVLAVPWRQPRYKLRELFALVPTWARVLIIAALIYAIANFVFVLPQSGGGDPVQKDGRYFFNNHGVVREVNESEFHAQRSVTMRGFSSVWFYLYLVSALYLLTARRSP